MHAIYHFGIAKATPLDREISFDELSLACGLNTADPKRLVRMATTRHIFVERRPGYIEHTAASKLLADSKLVHDFVGIITEEKFKASASVSYINRIILLRLMRIYRLLTRSCNGVLQRTQPRQYIALVVRNFDITRSDLFQGFRLGHNTKMGLYKELQTLPERAAQIGRAHV